MIDNHSERTSHIRPAERQWPGTTDTVRREVETLASEGLDVQLVPSDYGNHFLLPSERQLQVTTAIAELEQVPDFKELLLNKETNPAGAAWAGMAKSALALNAFYNIGPDMKGPADGIDPTILHQPLIGGKTPYQLVYEKKRKDSRFRNNTARADAAAESVLQKTETFLSAGSLWDVPEGQLLSPGDFIAGAVDRIGDVTRATAVQSMVNEHIAANREHYERNGVVVASMASGVAEPMYWIAKQLEADGIAIRRIHNVDVDPVALAASRSRAEAYGLAGKVQLHYKNILKTPVKEYIDDRPDFAEAVGLIEYLSRHVSLGRLGSLGKYRLAGNLLVDMAQMVRPGGMLLFGNMLDSRSQQAWFDEIWPQLHQRSVREVISLLEEVGFSREQISVRIAEGEGLYALYGIRIPEESKGTVPTVPRLQRELGKQVMRRLRDY